jgi:molecular chaperone DnaK
VKAAAANKSLGQFNLGDIPPAPRGIPQIEVEFNIDANGILHVSAKDKASGKQANITIQASSGLSEEEIQRMVKDAEANAEEDKKLHELVTARNQAEGLIHSVKKSLSEHGDKIDAAEKAKIEDAVKAAEEVVKSEDKAEIEAKTEELAKPARSWAKSCTPRHSRLKLVRVLPMPARPRTKAMWWMPSSKKSKTRSKPQAC